MAEQGQIDIQVEFAGATEAARAADQVASGLGHVDDQARAATASTAATTSGFAQMATGGQQMAQRIQGAVGAVQSLVSALGSSDHTAGLIASAAGATAQFAAMGSMFGPAGTLIGGLAGLAAGVASVADQMNEGTTAAERYAAALTTVQARVAARDAARRAEEIAAGRLGGLSGVELETEIEARRARLAEIADERGSGLLEALGFGDPERLSAETRRIREEIATLEGAVTDFRNGLIVEEGTIEIIPEDDPRYTGRTPGRGGGRRASTDTQTGAEQGFGNAGADRSTATQINAAEELAAAMVEIKARQLEEERALEEQALEEASKRFEEEREMAENQAAEMIRLGEEVEAERQRADEIALDQREKSIGELTGLFGQTANALGGALKSIATGEKTAEDAFKGLAAAFLEMISQYATMKAATEFADAASSFARYDYGGGAAHIGAGVAFTAVAVATGIGAAVINSPPQAPARPETSAAQGAVQGGVTVVNFNSPVVTASTEAELGRRMSTMIGAGASI